MVAQVMGDVREESRCTLRELFGVDAFSETLNDALRAYFYYEPWSSLIPRFTAVRQGRHIDPDQNNS